MFEWDETKRQTNLEKHGLDFRDAQLIFDGRPKELKELVKKDGSCSDWKKAASMTDAQIEAAIADDPDEAGMIMDWENATVELSQPKAVLNMRIDKYLLEYFRKSGKGYQSRINAILRSYVEYKPHSLR